MAGGSGGKPYCFAGEQTIEFKKEVKTLPTAIKQFILPRIPGVSNLDRLHDMILCCYEAIDERGRFSKRIASQSIAEITAKQQQEYYTLYNPHRNISLDQPLGDSRTPASEWLNVSDWREWE